MCRSLDEGGRRCKAHGSFREIPDDADAWLEDHPSVPTGKAVTVRVSETDARQIADAPGLLLAARITAPVEEEPFAAGSYLQRSGEQVPAHAEPLRIKRNVFLSSDQLEALRVEAEILGLPTSTLAQMKVAGDDVYAHAQSMKKQAREDREAWMGISRADREALVKDRSAADAEVQAAEANAALLARVKNTVAQGEAAIASRRAELEAFIILKQGREGAYEAVGEAIRERKLLTLNLESIREEQKQADRALQVATAKRKQTWDRALVLMQLAAVVLPPRTRPFSNAFIMGFSAVSSMRAGAR